MKRSLFKGKHHTVQPYTPARFEEESVKKSPLLPPAETEVSEEELRARAAAREEQGYQKGYEKGYDEGRAKSAEEGRKEIGEKLGRLEEVIRGLENFKAKKTDELLPDIIELSLEIAKKIVHKEIELDKNIVMFIARDAIKRVGEKEENIVIKVNPIDYEIMISSIGLLKEQAGLKHISIEPLTAISPGGCSIETQTGEVDARIEEQFKEIQDAISTTTDREV